MLNFEIGFPVRDSIIAQSDVTEAAATVLNRYSSGPLIIHDYKFNTKSLTV